MMHKLYPSEQPLWLDANRGLREDEAEDRAYWAGERGVLMIPEAAGRDWLLSRMLRRPHLVNRTCRAHGWANTYTHDYSDLVIEYCCDDELVHRLQDAGATTWPDDPRLAPYRDPEPGNRGCLLLGDARIIHRRGYCSGNDSFLAMKIADKTEWYR